MDSQRCPVMVESFGQRMDTLYFGWLTSPIKFDSGIQYVQFFLKICLVEISPDKLGLLLMIGSIPTWLRGVNCTKEATGCSLLRLGLMLG